MMKSIFFLFAVALCYGCSDATGQSSPPKVTETVFEARTSNMMPPEARNVYVGSQSVAACYNQCQTQITLNYCGQAIIEKPGISPDVYAAQVYQIAKGQWIAEIEGGQYVRINSITGTAQMNIAGEYQYFGHEN